MRFAPSSTNYRFLIGLALAGLLPVLLPSLVLAALSGPRWENWQMGALIVLACGIAACPVSIILLAAVLRWRHSLPARRLALLMVAAACNVAAATWWIYVAAAFERTPL
jgi:hypothetical protein